MRAFIIMWRINWLTRRVRDVDSDEGRHLLDTFYYDLSETLYPSQKGSAK